MADPSSHQLRGVQLRPRARRGDFLSLQRRGFSQRRCWASNAGPRRAAGCTRLLSAFLAIWPLTTHPFWDGSPFTLLVEAPTTLGAHFISFPLPVWPLVAISGFVAIEFVAPSHFFVLSFTPPHASKFLPASPFTDRRKIAAAGRKKRIPVPYSVRFTHCTWSSRFTTISHVCRLMSAATNPACRRLVEPGQLGTRPERVQSRHGEVGKEGRGLICLPKKPETRAQQCDAAPTRGNSSRRTTSSM